jgi:hypothetical protein
MAGLSDLLSRVGRNARIVEITPATDRAVAGVISSEREFGYILLFYFLTNDFLMNGTAINVTIRI